MDFEGKSETMKNEQNPESTLGSTGMLRSFAMIHAFKNRPLRRFQQKLRSRTSQVKAGVQKRFFHSNGMTDIIRQFSQKTLVKRKNITLAQGSSSKQKARKWSALAMTLPTGSAEDQSTQPSGGSLSSRTFTSGQAIPPFSLPDEAPLFRQATMEAGQVASKPKWKPPEPGARRFSRIEEIQAPSPVEAPTAPSSATAAGTTVQRSPKPGLQPTTLKPVSAQPTTSVKPSEPPTRQAAAPTPAIKTPVGQRETAAIPSSQSSPSQRGSSQVSVPIPPKVQAPGKQIGQVLPDRAASGLPTPPGDTAVEPIAEVQKATPGPVLASPQTPGTKLPTPQPLISTQALPLGPEQEQPQPLQMPLTTRRVMPRLRKAQQSLLSQHSLRLTRPKPILPKAGQAPLVQRKTFQLPLKQRTTPQAGPAAASPRDAGTAAQALNPLPIEKQTIEPAFTKPQVGPGASFTGQTGQELEKPQTETPGLQTTTKAMPLQRKNPQLPLKRPAFAVRKPLTTQTHRPNRAAMPIRRKLAMPEAARQKSGELQIFKPSLAQRATAPSTAPTPTTPEQTLPTFPAAVSPKAPAPGAGAASSLPGENTQSGIKAVDSLGSSFAESPEAATNAIPPILSLPLINKTILRRATGRKQLLRPRQITYFQREPGQLTAARPTVTRFFHSPVQTIQRSLRKGTIAVPTRIVPISTQIPGESPTGSQMESPIARPRFEASRAVDKAQKREPSLVERVSAKAKAQPTSQPKAQAPSLTPPAAQTKAQAPGLTPVPAQTARAKTVSPTALPAGISKRKGFTLSAFRKAKPVLPGQAIKSPEAAAKPTKLEGQPAITRTAPSKVATPIHAIKSSPVVQRKPQEGLGWMYQTENQDLPLIPSPSSPQPSPQNSYAPSSSHAAPPSQPPPTTSAGPSFSAQQQSSPPEPPEPPSGYVNPFAEEQRPEMPLRTPPRPNVSESPSQSEQVMTGPSIPVPEESHAPESTEVQVASTEAQKHANLQELARKVYPEIIRMLSIESEWFGRQP
jgi:hypothetical protein